MTRRGKAQNGAASASVSTEARGSKDDEWFLLEVFIDEVNNDIFQLLIEANVKKITANIVKKLKDFLNVVSFMKWMPEDGKSLGFDSITRCNILSVIDERVKANTAEANAEKSRKRKKVSDQENCGPTPKKAKSQSRSTVLQSQNSNNSSPRYNSGSKGFSNAKQSDVNVLFQTYDIARVHRKNPNPQDERFLSIFGLKASGKFEPEVFDPKSKSSEKQEYDVRIQQLKNMDIFTDTTKFRIKNVQKPEDGNPYKLAVPITNGILAGKTDVVIQYDINNDLDFDEYFQVVALIEFKTCDTFYSDHQGIFEYIGACIRGTLPVILVQTDMRDFRFLVLALDAGSLVLYDYLIQSSSTLNGFVILNNWLNLFHSFRRTQCRNPVIENWFKDMNLARKEVKEISTRTRRFLMNGIQTRLSQVQIIDAYKSNRQLICDELHSRTGRVYKIHIDGNAYALKVPRHGSKKIEDELKNEARIYLEFLNRVCDDAAYWPRLHYWGELEISENEHWEFVILTSYLEGRKVNLKPEYKHVECKKWEYVVDGDRDLCDDTLTSLNSFGIWHGDARTSNFVIVYDKNRKKERAKVLDFGYSQISTQLNEKLKDDEIVKSNNFT